MTALLGPIFGFATEVLKLINTETALSLVNQLKDLEMKIIAEEAKGYDSDDAKLETYYKQLPVLIQAVNNEFSIFKGGAASSPTAPAPSAPSTSS